jgi:hypothetical protein
MSARKDIHRKAREKAKKLAEENDIQIEKTDGGFSVYPPSHWQGDDPHEGHRHCNDWEEVLVMVQEYSRELS